MRQLTDEGQPSGPPVKLAAVDTGTKQAIGPLAHVVRQIRKLHSVRLSLVGASPLERLSSRFVRECVG